ncbi:CYTH and CHAD domain-containing protein [Corynebacterium sphenisci]|uniref:CYTH and CHAD domain-containing protein n=1 Tax=Corynebacterium sphenisci TaxID=191493 RepID=UPI0026E11191|nr:CYTH and CHAD domain-containing protein [Corynebacterium sphenisci]MDO5731712.1 CYTH and CHAD domain-containing protein [Corynebacterium sphenisci]
MSATRAIEVEAKFAAGDDLPDPGLGGLIGVAGVAAVGEPETIGLCAVYHDTDRLTLTRARCTLRRRTGGADAGWHLKTPAEAGRVEYGAPLGEADAPPPAEVLAPVRALVRGRALSPIAVVDNTRRVTRLQDAAGTVLGEFCDDRVRARSLLPGGTGTSWREWEFELAEDLAGEPRGAELLAAARELLLAAGATEAASPSKLATALGDSAAAVPAPAAPARPPKGTAARAVVDALAGNRDVLLDMDPRVRRDEFDSVHRMRVATRELRSHLRTFRGILGGERYELVAAELKALGRVLGAARDAEVVAGRLAADLEREGARDLDEGIRAHLIEDIRRDHARAHRRVVLALDSDRYLRLLDELDALIADPPVRDDGAGAGTAGPAAPAEGAGTGAADAGQARKKARRRERERTRETLLRHLEAAYAELIAEHEAVADAPDPAERDRRLHEVRKAAKKLRYSADAAKAAGVRTRGLRRACRELQSSLGEHQDAVTTRAVLRRQARRARRRGRDTFGYGVLHQMEHAAGRAALADYGQRIREIRRRHRRMMREGRAPSG